MRSDPGLPVTAAGSSQKDTRIRYNPAEREAVKARRARCFCLTSQSVTGEALRACFLDNRDAIVTAGADQGPFIFAVHRSRIERLSIGNR